jgi:2'-5' RNA ligase
MESVLALAAYDDDSEEEVVDQPAAEERNGSGEGRVGVHGEKEVSRDGRVRSFPHVKGNFPGFVFVPIIGAGDALKAAAMQAVEAAALVLGPSRVLHRIPLSEVHLSLSRTFAVRRPQIDSLVQLLRDQLHALPRFTATLCGAALYSNDDASRTFVGLRLDGGEKRTHMMVRGVDRALETFRVPPYYSDLSFHVSIAWTTGALEPGTPSVLELAPLGAGDEEAGAGAGAGKRVDFAVDAAKAKIGARTYRFELRS